MTGALTATHTVSKIRKKNRKHNPLPACSNTPLVNDVQLVSALWSYTSQLFFFSVVYSQIYTSSTLNMVELSTWWRAFAEHHLEVALSSLSVTLITLIVPGVLNKCSICSLSWKQLRQSHFLVCQPETWVSGGVTMTNGKFGLQVRHVCYFLFVEEESLKKDHLKYTAMSRHA